jgi:hypothetical protein
MKAGLRSAIRISAIAVGALVALWLCFGIWFVVATDYGDNAVSGTYDLAQNGEKSTLIVKPDHTFQQQLARSGKVSRATGTWRTVGEGGIAFSTEFIVVAGQELGANRTAYGEFHRTLGLLPMYLTLTDHDVEWYGKVVKSNDNTTSGTYAGDEEGVPATLTIRPDHTFEQTISHSGIAKHAQGTWNLDDHGEIVFSKSFIKTTGDQLQQDETAISFGGTGPPIQIVVSAISKSGVPTFRKRLLPW